MRSLGRARRFRLPMEAQPVPSARLRAAPADPWEPEGLVAAAPPEAVVDPWAPAPVLRAAAWAVSGVVLRGPPLGREEAAAPPFAARLDPWDPEPRPPRAAPVRDPLALAPRIDLPVFSPAARRPWFEAAVFDAPWRRGAAEKARSILDLAPAASSRSRPRLLAAFEAVFEERPDEAFFRRLRKLALGCEDGAHLHRAVVLKLAWDEAPEYWLYRAGRTRAGARGEPGRAGLTWTLALRVARRCDEADWDALIEPDWEHDWRRLRPDDAGYAAFAQYVALRLARPASANHRALGAFSRDDWSWREGAEAEDVRAALPPDLRFGERRRDSAQARSLERLRAGRLRRKGLAPAPAP